VLAGNKNHPLAQIEYVLAGHYVPRQHRWQSVLAGGLSCPPAHIAICAGTRVLAGVSPTSTDMIWPPRQIVSGLVGAQLLFQEADPLLSVSGEMVFLAEHGGQLADDGAHHARGGPRHHFGHLDSQALALRQILARFLWRERGRALQCSG